MTRKINLYWGKESKNTTEYQHQWETLGTYTHCDSVAKVVTNAPYTGNGFVMDWGLYVPLSPTSTNPLQLVWSKHQPTF